MYQPTTAMIFAAGFGKRMRPLTENTPKPLIKVAGRPLIDYTIENVVQAGIEKAVVNTHYLADQVKNYVSNINNLQATISHEDEILETGGGIVKALPLLGDKPFITMNSDIILTPGKGLVLQQLTSCWDADKMDVLMLLYPVEKSVGYNGKGDFELSGKGQVLRPDNDSYKYVFTGSMLIKPEIFTGQDIRPFSVYRDFIEKKYKQPDGSLSKVYGVIHDGGWLHVGDVDGIRAAEEVLSAYVL